MAHIPNSWARFAETGLLRSRHPDHMGFDLYCGCCKVWGTDGHLAARQRHMAAVQTWQSDRTSDYDKLTKAVAYFTWPEAIAELEGICQHIRATYELCRNERAAWYGLPQPFPAMLAIAPPPPGLLQAAQPAPAYVSLPPLGPPPGAPPAPGPPADGNNLDERMASMERLLQDVLSRLDDMEVRLHQLDTLGPSIEVLDGIEVVPGV